MKRPMVLEFYRAREYTRGVGPVGPIEKPGTFWRWRIRASNGRVIADSAEAYGRLRDCVHGAGLVTGMTEALGRCRPGELSHLTPRHEDDALFSVVVDK